MNGEQQGRIYRWQGDQPLDLAGMLALLHQSVLLPDGASWWFGWNELEIALPQQLRAAAPPGEQWDVLHIFSSQIELRYVRQGRARRAVLLMEDPLPPDLAGWGEPESYRALPGLRLLAGGRLRLPSGVRRGVVAFPRPLEYGLAEDADDYQSAVVADVRLYYDAEARLRTVRYLRLRHLPPGDDAGRVDPYAAPLHERE